MNEPKDYEYLLLCDGSTISEDNYPELVAVLGGTQLPNLIDRFLQGSATAGTYKEAGLPNITGQFSWTDSAGVLNTITNLTGAFYSQHNDINTITRGAVTKDTGNRATYAKFSASRESSIYGNSTTVQPPAYTAKIYICYAG